MRPGNRYDCQALFLKLLRLPYYAKLYLDLISIWINQYFDRQEHLKYRKFIRHIEVVCFSLFYCNNNIKEHTILCAFININKSHRALQKSENLASHFA